MRKIIDAFLLMMCLCSCNAISSIVHDDQVVARVGDHKLYLSEMQKYVPEFVSPEDSAAFAQMYITNWAKELLYSDLASEQLSVEELDVTEQLEEYRQSLLKYRYEQQYINTRMDTLVTEAQIQEYYAQHKSLFRLERPVFKVRFVDIPKDSKDRDRLLKFMSSREYEDAEEAERLAANSALKYFDSSDNWMDAIVLAREFGVDHSVMISNIKGSWIKIELEGRGDLMAAYIVESKMSGDAPVEFCEGTIRDYILSARKHALLQALEQDLLRDALDKKKFVIYQ